MENICKIPIDRLDHLRDIYKIAYPSHIVTCSTIQLFIDRFKKHPEWIERVSFLSLNDDWIKNGTFVMICDSRIFCNTLEPSPYESLRQALLSLELDDEMTFVHLRDELRTVIFDVIRIQYFEVISDIGTKCYLLPKESLKNMMIGPPEGFEFKAISRDDVKKINELWPGKFRTSEKFIDEAIKYNTSMGMYDKDGKLVAWNMRIDNGSMGIGQVDSYFSGNRYGHSAVLALASKIAKDFDTDVHFEIRNSNVRAEKSAKASQVQVINTQSWIAIRRKKPDSAPMWGHL